MALSKKRQAFVSEYLIDKNATQAAIRAGYSEKTARQQGSRLLSNASIQEEISRRLEELKMSADDVIIGITEIAGAADKDSDRLRAYHLLGQYHALFVERRDITTDGKRIGLVGIDDSEL